MTIDKSWPRPISKFQAESESGYNASLLRKLVQVSGTPCLNLGKGLCSTSQAINITHISCLVVILSPESNALARTDQSRCNKDCCYRVRSIAYSSFYRDTETKFGSTHECCYFCLSEKCHDHYPESQDNQACMDLIKFLLWLIRKLLDYHQSC